MKVSINYCEKNLSVLGFNSLWEAGQEKTTFHFDELHSYEDKSLRKSERRCAQEIHSLLSVWNAQFSGYNRIQTGVY